MLKFPIRNNKWGDVEKMSVINGISIGRVPRIFSHKWKLFIEEEVSSHTW